jgi:prepilin-type N-terminal cleavage/methylation domain-containing protein
MRESSPARTDVGAQRPEKVRDRGVSLIEVVIAVVLLGMVVAATLTGLTATINASALDRDHANAHAWLQTAADMLYARDPIECSTEDEDTGVKLTLAQIQASYQTTVQSTDNPEGWSSPNITVTSLEFWSHTIDKTTGVATEAWLTACNDLASNLQKVGLRVTAEDGRIVEEVEVIIGG